MATIGEWQRPMRLNQTTPPSLGQLIATSPAEEASRYRRLFDHTLDGLGTFFGLLFEAVADFAGSPASR